MNRRAFAQTLAGAVGALTLAPTQTPAVVPAKGRGEETLSFNQDAQPHAPFQLSVMLWTILRDLPFEQRLEKVAEAGYHNVELVGEYEKWTAAEFHIANTARKTLGINFDCTAGLKHGVSVPNDRELLIAELRHALPIMEQLDCPAMILLSGNRVPGMPREMQHQSCIETLKAAAGVIEGKSINGQPVRLLLETIDPVENPEYYLTEIAEALGVVESVNHPQVQLLYDFYHQQIAAGNLISNLEKSLPHLGLVHIADVPGRHLPGTGEINYENIFRKLAELNYTGVVAMEFLPERDPVAELRAAREMALRAGADGLRKRTP